MSQVWAKVYYFALVISALFFTIIRLRSLFGLDRYQYTVTMQKQISDDTFMMTLAPQDANHIVTPNRGQYVYIRLGVVSEDHPFSVVQYEEDTGKLTVAYRVFGTFTESLSRYTDGSTVLLDGPYGSFTSEIETETKPVVFIAGGIGVTPFVDHILRGNLEEQWLFYASKDESRATFLPVLQDELGAHCIPIFSSANNGNRIDSTIIKNHLKDPSKYIYFMCGPVGLMDTSQEALESLGVPRAQIYREAFAF
jgi:predicted ferric reductase